MLVDNHVPFTDVTVKELHYCEPYMPINITFTNNPPDSVWQARSPVKLPKQPAGDFSTLALPPY